MTQRTKLAFALGSWAAIAAMAYGQYAIRLDPNDDIATSIVVVAALLAALFLRGEGSWPALDTGPFEGRRWPLWVGIVVVVLGMGLVGCGTYLLTLSFQTWVNHGWFLIIVGTSLASLGFYGLDPKGKAGPGWNRTEILVLLGIFLLGLFLRFYRYTDFPPPYTMHAIEEPQAGMRAHFLLKGVYFWEFIFDNYLAAASMWLFGDRSILVIRIPFTIVSALTVFPLYLLLRQAVSKPAALAATFLSAVSAWNIIYSRCAHNIFAPNMLVVLAFALCFRVGRTHRLAGAPWAALLSAFMLYNYAAYRGTALLALLLLGGGLLVDLHAWRRATDAATRALQKRFVLRMAVAIALVLAFGVALFAPIYKITAYNSAQPGYYFEAANRSLSNKEYYSSDPQKFIAYRVQRIKETSRIFMHKGDGSDTFNEPGEPMLDPLTSVAFIGGIFLVLVNPGRRFNLWILAGFLFVMIGGTVFVQNLDVRRLQGATPFVMMLVALFVDRVWLLAQRFPRKMVVPIAILVAVAGGSFCTFWGYNIYFNKMSKNRFVRQSMHNRYLSIVHYGRTLGTGHFSWLLSDIRFFFHPSDFYWLIEDLIAGTELRDITDALPPKKLPRTPLPINVVVQHPYERHESARLLQQVYPGTQCNEFAEEDNPYITLTSCSIPKDVSPQPLQMHLMARYYHGNQPAGTPVAERQEPYIGFGTYPPECYLVHDSHNTCAAEWSGILRVPRSGVYKFNLASREHAKLTVQIDGKPLTGTTMELTEGEHQFSASAIIPRDSDTGVRFEWVTKEGNMAVPFYDLSPDLPSPEPLLVAPTGEPAAAAH